jgi:stearoyl-CoA desaturase (delta-9 desaturase)
MGEGYHNYHHSFQRDYRNGIRWWQFDPTKWLISSLAFFRLARNLYRTPLEQIEAARAQMQLNKTTLKLALHPQSEKLIQQVQNEYEKLIARINEFSVARKQWVDAHKSSVKESCDRDLIKLKNKVESLKQGFIEQKRSWQHLNASFA